MRAWQACMILGVLFGLGLWLLTGWRAYCNSRAVHGTTPLAERTRGDRPAERMYRHQSTPEQDAAFHAWHRMAVRERDAWVMAAAREQEAWKAFEAACAQKLAAE